MSLFTRTGRAVLRMLPSGTVVPVLRGPLRGLRWVASSAPHGAWLGRMERQNLAHFAAHLTPESHVWDVGANVGLYALTAARIVRPPGVVVAFEPAARNLAYLKRHLALNMFPHVQVVAAAVSDRDGTGSLRAGDSPSEFHLADGGDAVPLVSLDSWRRSAGAAPPDVIKIDVEGGESAVLRGAEETIALGRPRIYLAVHAGQHEACETWLRARGYSFLTNDGRTWSRDLPEWIAVSAAP